MTIKDNIQRGERRLLNDIPNFFEEAFVLLDSILTTDEKSVIKCANEEQLLAREIFPDIWMWSFNAFKIGNKESSLGREIKENGIYQRGSIHLS